MKKPVQKRTLATRAKLLAAAKDVISANSYSALRVEEVVQKAGVAKGTFFAHFPDKDALMECIIADEINAELDKIAALPAPDSVEQLVHHLVPLLQVMSSERYVFDVILRHSGAAAKEEIGPIALTFVRQDEVIGPWLDSDAFRRDVPPRILAEGLQAFAIQALALNFCAINNEVPLFDRLTAYLKAWLIPGP